MINIKNSTPLIITDTKGKILTVNEAAHNICAALTPGRNIESCFTDEATERYRVLLSEKALSFVLTDALGCESIFFDLTKERTEGVRILYLSGRQLKIEDSIDYGDIAEVFTALSKDFGFQNKRRFTELYDTLSANGCVFGSKRIREFFGAKLLTERFLDSVLPRLLYVNGDVIFTPDPSLDENSIIFAEPYGFYLLMCAVISIAAHVSADHIHISARDAGDKVTITVSTTCNNGKRYERAADFGVRALDVLYAESLSRISGYSFSYECSSENGIMTFTVSFNSHDYYPSYLKTDAAATFILSSVSKSVIYPGLTE